MKKIFILLMLLNAPCAYTDEEGISRIVIYLINNQSDEDKMTSLSFQKQPRMLLRDETVSIYPVEQDLIRRNIKKILSDFQKILDEHQCSIGIDEAVLRLVKQNNHHTVLKVTYKEIHDGFYYDPLHINNCNLVLAYAETHIGSRVSNGTIMLFEILENRLRLIIEHGGLHTD